MADEKEDVIKANIYAERPGNTVKPTIVTEPLPAAEHVEKETKEKLTQTIIFQNCMCISKRQIVLQHIFNK